MLVADAQGAPVGILGPKWWVRTEPSLRAKFPKSRSVLSETQHVLDALNRAEDVREASGSRAQLWFQLDRGFDAWPVFWLAAERDGPVRLGAPNPLAGNSGLRLPDGKKGAKLGSFTVQIPERHDRPARTAKLSLRSARVDLHLQVGRKRKEFVPVSAVYAVEEAYRGRDRLCWMLLTTADVRDLISARAVVLGYTTRWLIEELHRTWKRGWTNVERTQLRRRNSICKWATLHLALAARALRLTKLARTDPELPADTEFSSEEIQAIQLLNRRSKALLGTAPPRLGDLVFLLAELGGYDRYSKKPAGATVIGRGLTRIASLAEGLKLLKGAEK